jgi:TonB family protein
MSRTLALLFACCLAWAAAAAQTPPAGPDPAQQPAAASPELAEAQRLNAEVAALYRAGKYGEAVEPARRALELTERAHGAEHLAVAYAAANLATLYFELKKDAEAEPLFKRALAAGEKLGAPARPLLTETSNKLAVISFREKNYEEAQQHLLRALELTRAARGADDPSLVPILLNLTDVAYQRRQSEEAESRLTQAVESLLKLPPRKDPETSDRLKRFICVLPAGERAGELPRNLRRAVRRLEDPDQALERERLAKEAQDGGVEPEASDGMLNERAISKAAPRYPAEAKQRRLSGKAIVWVTVDGGGSVTKAEPLCGHPVLTAAAVEAVRQWRFKPALINGKPVEQSGTVFINFTFR